MKKVFGLEGRSGLESLRREVERAEKIGDKITIAVLIDELEPMDDANGVVEAVEEMLKEQGTEHDIVELSGHPGGELVRFSESGGFDEIVLCGAEKTPLGKVSIGEATEFVLLNSHVSVKIIR